MSKFSKKAVAAGVSVATAAWLSGAAMLVPVAGAVTTADLQAQITALLAQIAALQAQLGGAAAAKCTFTKSLTVGSTGAEVKCLQQYLNGAGYQVSASGAGSAGNETTYFGAKTKAAVAKWQAANGVSPAVGYFGPLSRGKYDALVATTPTTTPTTATTTTPVSGVEGSLSAKLDPGTADLQEVKEGESDKTLYAVEVKATDNSVTVNRVDLNFNARAWLFFSNLSLWDGNTKLWSDTSLTSGDFEEITSGSDYKLRIGGLSLSIAKGEKKVLTLKGSMPTQAESTGNITVTSGANSIRGTDPTAKTQDAPSAALTARTVRTLDKDTGDLEISVNSDTPKNQYVQVSETGTTEVPTVVFNAKAKNNSVEIKTLKASHTALYFNSVASSTDTLKLYNGSTLLSTATPTASGTVVFSDVNLKIAKDETKTLTIKATIKKVSANNYLIGERVSSSIDAAAASITTEDGNFQTGTVSGSDVNGNQQHLFIVYPKFALVSSSITPKQTTGSNTTRTDKAEAKIRISVKAVGGDVYLMNNHATRASSGFVGSSTNITNVIGPASSSTVAAVADSLNSGGTVAELKTKAWLIPNGQTKVFETTVQMQTGQSGTADFHRGYITAANWNDADNDIGTGNTATNVAATTTVAAHNGFATSNTSPGDYISPVTFLEAGFNP